MLSMGMSRPERALILNYNTVFLQSVGFVNLMNQSGLDHKLFSDLDPFGLIYFFTRAKTRNTASMIDQNISEADYFDFVKKKYKDIGAQSPITNITPIINIMTAQNFVEKVFIASFDFYTEADLFKNVQHVKFDIFDVKVIEAFITENQITTVFLHDIRLVHDLVFNFQIDVKAMSFIVSKFGYNFMEKDGIKVSHCPEIFELRSQLEFNIAYINLDDSTRGFEDNEM
jgi:hypothetical protein